MSERKENLLWDQIRREELRIFQPVLESFTKSGRKNICVEIRTGKTGVFLPNPIEAAEPRRRERKTVFFQNCRVCATIATFALKREKQGFYFEIGVSSLRI